MSRTKKYVIRGVISSLPLFLTFYIIVRIYEFVLSFIKKIVPIDTIATLIEKIDIFSSNLNNFFLKMSIYIMTFLIIYFLMFLIGVVTSHLIDVEAVKYLEKIFMKIPLAKPIYITLKQIREALFSKNIKSYKKVVLIEYPSKGIYCLGFLTNSNNNLLKEYIKSDCLINIFIPTSPNPTSGMFIMMDKKDVIELNIKVEEAIKLIVSGGAILPDDFSENIKRGE